MDFCCSFCGYVSFLEGVVCGVCGLFKMLLVVLLYGGG